MDTLGQLANSDAASRRLVTGEVLLVDGVHAGEVGHVIEEDGGLEDAVEGSVGSLEDCGKVVEDGFLCAGQRLCFGLMVMGMRTVHSSMVPVITFPSLSAGIWPETKTRPLPLTACDCAG